MERSGVTEGSTRSFRVIERLGQGAFGAVYLAETEGTGLSRRVAIKVPHADRATPALLARLRDEARLLSLIRHRAIVRVDDLVELDGAWSVVMEYVEGCDLAELLADGPIPPRPALGIAAEVAQALHAAYHQAAPDGAPIRLLHRDIKPSNLRVTAAGEVKILDFGVARAEFEAREAHATRSVFGTTTYLAPERYHGEDSRAGDVYALGVTLFEMLTGVPPGKSAMDADRQPPGRKWADQWLWLEQVSPPLKDLVARMLAPEPKSRPSARDCARELSEIRVGLGGIALEDWAEKVVPPKVRVKRDTPPEEQGSLLIERSTSQVAPVARPSGPSWGLVAAIGAVAVVLVVAAAVGGALWQSTRAVAEVEPAPRGEAPAPLAIRALPEDAPAPPPAQLDADAALAAPGGPMPAPEAPAPEAAAPEAPAATDAGEAPSPSGTEAAGAATAEPGEPATTATSTPKRSSSTKGQAASTAAPSGSATPTRSEPATTSTAAGSSAAAGSSTAAGGADAATSRTSSRSTGSGGRLVVSGEVADVRITGSRGAVRAGAVPADTYTVVASFAGGETAELSGVVVGVGQEITVRCSAVFKSCKVSGS